MPEDEALMQAILDSPEDDAPRLVLADWLEEHGEPDRAAFIRVQCALARGVADPELMRRLRERSSQLLREHELRWTAPLHSLVQRARFIRGFPERVTVMAEGFFAHADTLFRL